MSKRNKVLNETNYLKINLQICGLHVHFKNFFLLSKKIRPILHVNISFSLDSEESECNIASELKTDFIWNSICFSKLLTLVFVV